MSPRVLTDKELKKIRQFPWVVLTDQEGNAWWIGPNGYWSDGPARIANAADILNGTAITPAHGLAMERLREAEAILQDVLDAGGVWMPSAIPGESETDQRVRRTQELCNGQINDHIAAFLEATGDAHE